MCLSTQPMVELVEWRTVESEVSWFKLTGLILTSRTETISLSRVVRVYREVGEKKVSYGGLRLGHWITTTVQKSSLKLKKVLRVSPTTDPQVMRMCPTSDASVPYKLCLFTLQMMHMCPIRDAYVPYTWCSFTIQGMRMRTLSVAYIACLYFIESGDSLNVSSVHLPTVPPSSSWRSHHLQQGRTDPWTLPLRHVQTPVGDITYFRMNTFYFTNEGKERDMSYKKNAN